MSSGNFSWVFPPANVPANTFGPVHLYDTIALSWTPATLAIAPPLKIQMACRFTNESYVFVPVTNIKSPYLWFFNENYDSQPYQCWYGSYGFSDGEGGTGAAFHVVPTTAATAMTFSATATPTSTPVSTSSPATTTADTTSSTPSAAGSSNTTATTADSGLSSGAKAGIGVGVAAGLVILIALLLWLLFFRRRRNLQNRADPSVNAAHNVPEMNTKPVGPYDKPPLAYVEAQAPYPYVEADSREARAEMPA